MESFDHGLPENKYNKHAWIIGDPDIGENVWIGAFCVIVFAALKPTYDQSKPHKIR